MTGLRRSDGGERYLGTDHGAGDGDAEDVDQEGGVDGDLSVFETSEVFGEWEDAVPGDGGVEGVRFVGMYVQDGCWRRWIVLISFVCRLTWADRKQDAVAHWSLLTIRMSFICCTDVSYISSLLSNLPSNQPITVTGSQRLHLVQSAGPDTQPSCWSIWLEKFPCQTCTYIPGDRAF